MIPNLETAFARLLGSCLGLSKYLNEISKGPGCNVFCQENDRLQKELLFTTRRPLVLESCQPLAGFAQSDRRQWASVPVLPPGRLALPPGKSMVNALLAMPVSVRRHLSRGLECLLEKVIQPDWPFAEEACGGGRGRLRRGMD